MEKFQISAKNLNNLWSLIKIYAVFVLNLCGEKMTNMRSALLQLLVQVVLVVLVTKLLDKLEVRLH